MTRATDTPPRATAASFDVERIRGDFPILGRKIGDKPLVYLDSAATSQKPRATIEAINRYYRAGNANIHRGVHRLSVEATEAYEGAREKVQRFLGAARSEEIIFVRGATEGINLVAAAWGRANLGPGDEIILSNLEHHSNIVPWQLVCEEKGATIKVIPVNDAGELDLDAYEKLFTERTKLVGCVHVSNALGTINPVKTIVEIAHRHGALVLLDGAQAAPHLALDVQDIGCDFYATAGHKMFGPTGIGALYGRKEILEAMPPYQGGGDMILSVSFEKTTYNRLPNRFEAGTPNIAGAIGLGATIDYLREVGMDAIAAYEHELLAYANEALSGIPGLRFVGTAREKASVVSFLLDDVHPHDIGTILDQDGVAIRTGHHCTQPLMDRFGIAATARASFAFYNTRAEVDALAAGLRKVREVFELMSDLLDLYQELILDHNKRPRNRGALEHPDHEAEGYNPLCGDRVSIDVAMDGDVIAAVKFDGSGCAISTASASLMSEAVQGKTIEEARAIFERFRDLVTGGADEAGPTLGKLQAFAGVGRFPARVKCATLAWHTLQAALEDRADAVSTE